MGLWVMNSIIVGAYVIFMSIRPAKSSKPKGKK